MGGAWPKSGHCVAIDPVAVVLQPVDLDPVVLQVLEVAQLLEQRVELLARLDQHVGRKMTEIRLSCKRSNESADALAGFDDADCFETAKDFANERPANS